MVDIVIIEMVDELTAVVSGVCNSNVSLTIPSDVLISPSPVNISTTPPDAIHSNDGGQTVTQFYQNGGIVGRRKELLDLVREGKVPVSKISGMIFLYPRQVYDMNSLAKVYPGFS